ncbi:PKD domain-containing protein, partial [Methanoregula sp.]|uniref:PKD domain-containing protein n=1 Tax=Methanoregula sp. TaxID=2052170 RepID=UPI00261C0A80
MGGDCENNRFYQNIISGNGATATTWGTPPPTVISWESPDTIAYTYSSAPQLNILGNYWGSDYTGSDGDKNGIGDDALALPDGLGSDTAPLMGIWQDGTIHGGPDTIVPNAGFSADKQYGEAPPHTVQFVSYSSGPGTITDYAWDFGDETTSTEKNPSHTYTLAGTFTVTLTVTGPAGSDTKTKTSYIAVNAASEIPVASFTVDPVSGDAPLTVQFNDTSTNTPTSWAWDFNNDGTTDSTVQNSSYTYTTPGTYSVKLTVTNTGGSDIETKTDYIIVTTPSAPVAGFTATPTSGPAPLVVQFTDSSTGVIASYAWDFNNDGIVDSTSKNPTYTYTKAGNFTVNLTVSNTGGSSSSVMTDPISVTGSPDLVVSSISPFFLGYNTQNSVSASIKNQGTQDVGAFKVRFNVTGNTTDVDVASLAAGDSIGVNAADPVDRHVNDSVSITVTVDSGDMITESDETNNEVTSTETVIANGYAGHRWSTGPDITTKRTYLLHGDTIVSLGNSQYGANGASWTAGDLPIPEGAKIRDAHVYQTYTWDTQHVMGTMTEIGFNGVLVPVEHEYWEWKGWGNYADMAYGVHVANVTDQFNPNGNSEYGTVEVHPRGSALVVTYEDLNATEKQIFVNEGFDMLFANAAFYTTPETATAYAPFTDADINMTRIKSAKLITSITAGNAKGMMLFNGTSIPNYWTSGAGEVRLNTTDITPYLSATDNTVLMRSENEGWGMEPYLAILKVEYQAETAVPVAQFTATPVSGTMPLTVAFTDSSTGVPAGWQWDFDNDGTTDSTEQNPTHIYSTSGTFTVNLTVSNDLGSNSEIKTGYITVNDATSAPVAAFSAATTTGQPPFTVQFTDTSTNSPTSWSWDFGDGDTTNATKQNPVHTYANAGTYTVTLSASNAYGSGNMTKTAYIAVSTPAATSGPAVA